MKILVVMLFTLLACVCTMATTLAGEQRVLLSFDDAGHHVRQIVHPRAKNSFRSHMVLGPEKTYVQPDMQSLVSQLKSGTALLIWTDDDGNSHATTTGTDPRISHAPTHIKGADKSRMANHSGAWLVAGPDSATNLTILLPSDLSLGLGFEQWEVSLR